MKEVDPQSTSRALAFELWMKAPMPMVTLMKALDVTALVRLSRKRNYKFNMLLCWCIGKAAAEMKDFYLLPVGDKLMQYDRLAVNTVVATRDGGIATCDIPVSDHLEQFDRDYRKLTGQSNEQILENLRFLSEKGARIEIRIPFVPGCNDSVENLEAAGRILGPLRGILCVKLLPYHALARTKYASLGMPDTMPQAESPDEATLHRAAAVLERFGLRARSGRE